MIFTRTQWTTLEAVTNRVIPQDAFAGAWQAGVGDYLARQFEVGGLQGQVDAYRAGLDALEQEALAFNGQSFQALSPHNQDLVLSRVEAGQVVVPWLLDPSRFFQMLVSHMMEGFYADPGNGGNHGGVSWQMIGFEVRG